MERAARPAGQRAFSPLRMLYSAELRVRDIEVGAGFFSDHLPLEVSMAWVVDAVGPLASR